MSTIPRPPIIAIMGHIDHGKSTLLDYIRKSNVVSLEAGGITQHLSGYEIVHQDSEGNARTITFLDTPGHAAFTGMRERGARVADIAILVVSAEDGVKTQTIEALKTIRAANVPFIVAINKIDRPEANLEKTKMSLAEHDVLIEGYGGTIPAVPISALTGEGVAELLETVLLVAEVEQFTGDPEASAEGLVIESNMDPKRGIAATIVITNGTLHKGSFVVAGDAFVSTRMIENFLGKPIDSATFSSPIQLVGFNKAPTVGSSIVVCKTKREAEEKAAEAAHAGKYTAEQGPTGEDIKTIPIIIKTDVYGTAEAIEREVKKIALENVYVKVILKGAGAVSESDIKHAMSDKEAIILCFNVGVDNAARDLNEKAGVPIHSFNIIYKLTEWLSEELEKRRPRKEMRDIIGTAKVLKIFSKTKERQIVGCRIESGQLQQHARVSVLRREFEIATGTIVGLEHNKQKTKEVQEGNDCGVLVETKTDIAPGDVLQAFAMVSR